jgi:exodeoxyribonuclease V beta subunit
VFAFPAGTEAGQFLHELLELLDFPTARGEILRETARGLFARYGGLGVGATAEDHWLEVAEALVSNCLDTSLDAGGDGGLRLRDIGRGDRLSELEFHYPIGALTPAALRAALAPFPDYRGCADGLGFEPCRGLMHGFIDLVFRHRGYYYLADYKSNRLGLQLPDYDRAVMGHAMLSHRYDLQYMVYTVALHRFLGWRLPDYDYDHHFGGVYYLFLRGMRPSQGPRYGVYFDRPARQVIEALDGLFSAMKIP